MSKDREKPPPPPKPPVEVQNSRVPTQSKGVYYRSAITGRYVSKATAAKHPKTTIKESVKSGNSKPKESSIIKSGSRVSKSQGNRRKK